MGKLSCILLLLLLPIAVVVVKLFFDLDFFLVLEDLEALEDFLVVLVLVAAAAVASVVVGVTYCS